MTNRYKTTTQRARTVEREMRAIRDDVAAWCEKRGLVFWAVDYGDWCDGYTGNTEWRITIDRLRFCVIGYGKTLAKAKRNLLAKVGAK